MKKLKDVAALLANRINQAHYVAHYLKLAYKTGRVHQENSQWISVKEIEPPKDGTRFIAARYNEFDGSYDIGVVKWIDGTFAVIPTRDFRLSLIPTHWQYLPAIEATNTKKLDLSPEDIFGLKMIRNHFGKNDKSMFSHWAFSFIEDLVTKHHL